MLVSGWSYSSKVIDNGSGLWHNSPIFTQRSKKMDMLRVLEIVHNLADGNCLDQEVDAIEDGDEIGRAHV